MLTFVGVVLMSAQVHAKYYTSCSTNSTAVANGRGENDIEGICLHIRKAVWGEKLTYKRKETDSFSQEHNCLSGYNGKLMPNLH